MKQKHIDITFDLETCSLEVNAAVIQIAAVAWVRGANSFAELLPSALPHFDARVDLRSCVMDGFDFDRNTIQWWAEKPQDLRNSMKEGDCYPIDVVFREFCTWMGDIKELTNAETVSLWSQGSDFDVAILRHVCHKYDIPLQVSHLDFRDARTFILELVSKGHGFDSVPSDVEKLYDAISPLPQDAVPSEQVHNALYDAIRTSWNVNYCFSYLR